MADSQNNKVWVHILVEKDLADALDKMVEDDDTDRSKFIRKLIRQEKARREQLPSTDQPKRRKTDLRRAQAVAA